MLCPLFPWGTVAAAQDCATGTDQGLQPLLSVPLELPAHSSLFHLEAPHGQGVPSSVPCTTSRSPGLPSQAAAGTGGSQVPQAAVTPLHMGGKSARGCAESQGHVLLLLLLLLLWGGHLSSPGPESEIRSRHCCCSPWDQPQFGCCCQCQQKRWLEQRVLTVPQAPGPEGPWAGGWEGAAPCSPSAPHRAGRAQVGQGSKQGACKSLPALSAQSLALGAPGGQRQLLLVPPRVPVFSSAAPSVCAQQQGKASALQGQELLGSA